ncbi:MAG: hypothetical protein LBF16_03415 [Pseudomonadales bacterium]|jgi:hypothetical protein|nr:hypothetical protein [Pseudomonadales bacterium]
MAEDWFTRSFGNAVADIRQRVVERGWFGEAVTPRSQTITLGSSSRDASHGETLGWFEKHFGREPARDIHGNGRGEPARDIHGNHRQQTRGHDHDR